MDDPVLIEGVKLSNGTQINMQPSPTLRCDMAQAVAHWIRDDVVGAFARLGDSLRAVETYDSYDCRPRNRVRGAKISEHGRGNALDIRALKLASGATDQLTDPHVNKELREALRASACERFHTVLGPGSDGYHEGHIHLDLAPRHNDYRICQWAVRTPEESPQVPAAGLQQAGARVSMAAGAPQPVPLPRPRPKQAAGQR